MRYIYKLIDPETNDIRYIGQTDNIKRRYNDHISSSFNENSDCYNTYKARWIRKLKSKDLLPLIEIVEECIDFIQSNIRENYYIEKLTNEGYKLTNSHSLDVTEFSIETKKKMSNARKGKTLEEIVGLEKSIELKEYYSERIKLNNPNKNSDPLVREKISNTLKSILRIKKITGHMG
jgi:hypothetical protein